MNPQGSECAGLGRIWFVRIRGWKTWFARGASGYLLGPYRSSSDAEMALNEDLDAVDAGDLGRCEAERQGGACSHEYAEDEFPSLAACIEDFDGDAEWCVWLLPLSSGAELYFVGTPDGPLPELYYDRRRCRLAAIKAKAGQQAPSNDQRT